MILFVLVSRRCTPVLPFVFGNNRGMDVDADGQGVVTGQRLYQLIRQSGQTPSARIEANR